MSDEYPSDEVLEEIKNWSSNFIMLLVFIEEHWNDTGHVHKDEGVWEFVTGGWSGNEYLIDALASNIIAWSLLWQSSHCGGKHVFSTRKLPECVK